MPSEYTPTTEQIRNAYVIDEADEYRDPISAPANRRANERYFDRWLAEHDARVKAEAVVAERERCARIADADFMRGTELRRENYVRQEIAAAIREVPDA